MKNGRKAALVAAAVGILLVACGGKANETTASGEMVVPEMSSEDLLVSSLEYLLLDEEQAGQESQDRIEEGKKEPESAAAEYEGKGETAGSEDQTTGQDKPMGQEAVIYYGNGASHELNRETVEIEEVAPEKLIEALAKHNIVSLDTKVLSFEEEEQDGKKVLHLDLSKGVGEYLRTMSKEAECIIVVSIVNTFLENYSADEIYLLVEGEALVTSHAAYTEAVGQCTFDGLMNMLETSGTEEAQKKLPLIQEKN